MRGIRKPRGLEGFIGPASVSRLVLLTKRHRRATPPGRTPKRLPGVAEKY